MLKKFFDKDEIWFSVFWIILYVVGFSNADALSESLDIPKLLTVFFGLVLSFILWGFLHKHRLLKHVGLCPVTGSASAFLYFLPLALISSVNFWNGVTCNNPPLQTILYIISMCFVGFLEEVIFRGLLFTAMGKNSVIPAIIVSSLTFGMGHIVNLLLGAPLGDTLFQLVYASAIGFCYTVIFYTSSSILPCIFSHAFVNSTSVFAVQPNTRQQLLITAVQTILSIGYGVWLLHTYPLRKESSDKP